MSGVWDIYAVTMHGAILYHVKDATLTGWTGELDSYKSGFKFRMPDISYNHNYSGALTEFQLWRNGKFFDWGVSTKPRSTPNQGGVLEVQCNSILWYLYRRVFGGAFPRNLLLNGDMEEGPLGLVTPPHWTAVNCDVAVQNTNFLTGKQAVRLTNTVEQADAFLQQVVPWATGASQGDYGVLTLWFMLESFDAPAFEQRGVYCDAVLGGVSQDPSFYPFTASQPTGVWTRIQSANFIPASHTDGAFDNRLYVPKGTIVGDAMSFELEDSISTGPMGEDQALLIRAIIAYSQDTTTWGKSDLNITFDDTTIPLTGVMRNISFPFTENKRIFDAISSFTGYVDGFDFGLEFPDADGTETPGSVSRRVFHIYPIVPGTSPGKGRTWDPTVLKLKVNVTVQDVEPQQDGDQITTAMIVQSGNSGPGREQGGYVDASHYGGLILESVEQAPDTVSLNGLAGMAKKRCLQLNSGANIPMIKTHETAASPMIGKLREGDIVTVDLDYVDPHGKHGWATWQDQYRVMKMDMSDVPQDSLELTLNVVSL